MLSSCFAPRDVGGVLFVGPSTAVGLLEALPPVTLTLVLAVC